MNVWQSKSLGPCFGNSLSVDSDGKENILGRCVFGAVDKNYFDVQSNENSVSALTGQGHPQGPFPFRFCVIECEVFALSSLSSKK